jgi:glycosyltransferase involved in cell wall biosynthesis
VRILVLENEPSTARGGQELSLHDVCAGLASRGHDIELLYTKEGDLLPRYRTFCTRVDRVHAYNVNRTRTARALVEFGLDLVQSDRATPDLIYINQYFDSPFARLLGWRFHRPLVCHLRLPPPDRFCGQFRWGIGGGARFIAISNSTRDSYIARGLPADRVDMVHNGINVREWRARLPSAEVRRRLGVAPDTFLIVYAGRLHPIKNLELLIDAFGALPQPADLVIAGRQLPDGSTRRYDEELKERARAAGLAARCHFVGHVSPVAELYCAGDVTVLPSTWGEAFGRAVIESMACRTPAVASNSGGIPEILTGEFTRYLFPYGDASSLAARLSTLSDWRSRDPTLGERCRAHVEHEFSIERTVRGVERVLERAVAEWRTGAPVEIPSWRIH